MLSRVGGRGCRSLAKTINSWGLFAGRQEAVEKGKMVLTLTRQDEFLIKDEGITDISLRTADGSMGVKPGHEANVVMIEPGIIKINFDDGSNAEFATSGGFGHIYPETGDIHLATAEAIPTSDIDKAALQAELNKADDSAEGKIVKATLGPILQAM
eukprot:TRINITY_DN77259_c0_g1_i1.p1 TRINITY_DN77259_c0_g1~~TRINITY_DN77259_c0_g1_i1.p1  ORF type:complete len:156 (+),score=26.72 TRINITY_DN77259_c0_g1_i1:38-505(+)